MGSGFKALLPSSDTVQATRSDSLADVALPQFHSNFRFLVVGTQEFTVRRVELSSLSAK